MNKKKYNAVINAMRFTGDKEKADKLHERAEIYVFKSDIDEDVKKILMKNIYDDNIGGNMDTGYLICGKACDLIADSEELDNDLNDDMFYESESASVYTSDRLGYLNINNQGEISDKMKEFDCDIQTACAVWFDDMVRSVALELKDYITNN